MAPAPWPLLHPLLTQRIVRNRLPVLVRIPPTAQALMAPWARCGTAIRPLAYRAVLGMALRLDTLPAQVFVGAGEIALAVIVQVLLLVAEAVCALLAVVVPLWRVNTGLLPGGCIDPLRAHFIGNCQCSYKQQANENIFENRLDKWPWYLLFNHNARQDSTFFPHLQSFPQSMWIIMG